MIVFSKNHGMKVPIHDTRLPNETGALWFACQCFGIREEHLKRVWLENGVKHEDGASAEQLSRARAELGSASDTRTRVELVLWDALLGRFRRAGIAPASSPNNFTDEATTTLLTLYQRLRPRLDVRDVPVSAALWVLTENFFLPTLYSVILRFQGLGLGTEFHVDRCWYLPRCSEDKVVMPVPHVLDCWLRATGLRTPYGVASRAENGSGHLTRVEEDERDGWEKEKKKVGRWLSGSHLPQIEELHALVCKFPTSVSWLDDADSWKARFTLAYAVQRTCEKFDAGIGTEASLNLSQGHRDLARESVLCDEGKFLIGSNRFFAVRLLRQRLERRGVFEKIIAPARKPVSPAFGPNPSDEEIDVWRTESRRRMNPGNWFVDYLSKEAQKTGQRRLGGNIVEDLIGVDEFTFDCGVAELNRLLAKKRKRPGRR